jgi:hypothetical protein
LQEAPAFLPSFNWIAVSFLEVPAKMRRLLVLKDACNLLGPGSLMGQPFGFRLAHQEQKLSRRYPEPRAKKSLERSGTYSATLRQKP